MNPTLFFDHMFTLFLLMIAVGVIMAIAGLVDTYLNPPCNCAEIRRQERETGGVEL